MKLLFTGASGFLGSNVRPLLEGMYGVKTVGLSPKDDYTIDIAKEIPVLRERYDIVLHVAGKAHSVPKTEAERQVFFDVNLQGTKNLCTALERRRVPRAFIFISTVAVYGCAYGENITEDHPLDGDTPYAMSKRLAEEYLQKWCYEHNVILGIIRPSLIAGPNPPGKSGGYDSWYPQWEIPQHCWRSGTKECIDGTGYCKVGLSVGRKGRHLQCM